jgi:hypothetical protein
MQAHSDEDYHATDQQLPRGAAPREDAAVSSVSIVGISGIARIAPISDILPSFSWCCIGPPFGPARDLRLFEFLFRRFAEHAPPAAVELS